MKLKADILEERDNAIRCMTAARRANDTEMKNMYQGIRMALDWVVGKREDGSADISWYKSDEIGKYLETN